VKEDQPGLRMRMGREAGRISSQHAQLGAFFEGVARALERGDGMAAASAFTRFGDAFDAHISLEDHLFFPALHGMRPDFDRELTRLVAEHEGFRRDLNRLERTIEEGDLHSAARDMDVLGRALADHEAREEELVRRITAHREGR
jgi:hypothetical protein